MSLNLDPVCPSGTYMADVTIVIEAHIFCGLAFVPRGWHFGAIPLTAAVAFCASCLRRVLIFCVVFFVAGC